MTSYPVLLALAVLGLVTAASGLVLLARRVAVSGLLLAVAGGADLAATLAAATGHRAAADALLVAAWALAAPLAVLLHPAPAWRHPADFTALVVVAGAGGLAVARAGDTEVVGALAMVSALTLLVALWWRLERAGPAARQPLVWMALALGVAALLSGLWVFVSDGTAVVGVPLLWTLLGPALLVGVARPHMVDVRGLVVRAVVVAVAVVAYLALFVSFASFVEILRGRQPTVGVLAVVGVAAALPFPALVVVLRGVVDQLLFGHRPDPLPAVSGVAARIGDDPALVVHAVREALVLPYVALRVDPGEATESGVPVTHVRAFALPVAAGATAELVVGLRPGDLALGRDDEHVLRLVVPLLAQILRGRRLAADLQASRERTVTALENERRRVRRDLHDGLGPRLTGIAFTVDAARNRLRQQPDEADRLLIELRREITGALDDIRGLVYALRPPALDELGLVPALRQQVASLRTADGAPLRVDVRAGELGELPAAVEVAAYRIVLEALTNTARHSRSPSATVTLERCDGRLVAEVHDAGIGPERDWLPGVGLTSMRERAAELGGTLTAGPSSGGGRVRAELPLAPGGPRKGRQHGSPPAVRA